MNSYIRGNDMLRITSLEQKTVSQLIDLQENIELAIENELDDDLRGALISDLDKVEVVLSVIIHEETKEEETLSNFVESF